MANNESIGARLKRIRLEKGISIEDAHRSTRIHLEVLKAIEEDNYINISPVYLKGFLKIYCKFLEVELPETIAVKKQTQVRPRPAAEEPVREKKAPSMLSPRERKAPAAPAAAGPDMSRLLVPRIIAVVLVAVVCAAVFAGGKFLLKKITSGKNVSHSQIVRMKKQKIAAVKAQAARTKVTSAQEQIPKDESLRLGVRALEDCWLQLKADNKVIFQNILKKGRFENWEAKDRMDMVLGSAGGVQLEINGKIIPPLGKKGQVLKDIVISRRDGLKVGK